MQPWGHWEIMLLLGKVNVAHYRLAGSGEGAISTGPRTGFCLQQIKVGRTDSELVGDTRRYLSDWDFAGILEICVNRKDRDLGLELTNEISMLGLCHSHTWLITCFSFHFFSIYLFLFY